MNAALAGPARMLVVDDNEVNRDVLMRRLQRHGHAVEAVADGTLALARLRAQTFDLVLLDVMMPGIDGYEVLSRIKGDDALRHLPVIMITALDEADSVIRCIELGADDYLTKPFNPLILQARVNASLLKKRMHDGELRHLRDMEREFEIGRAIQRGFLPESTPVHAGWELAVRFRPARQVAGDFYDLFTTSTGHLAIVVADVCDKGVGAALYMALFRTLIRATASQPYRKETDPASILIAAATVTNNYIASVHGQASMFATVFLALLEPNSGALLYINAGHEPPLICGAAGIRQRLALTGPALGLLPEQRFAVGQAQLHAGELLLGYTDGVTEAAGPQGEFGEGRLKNLLGMPSETATAEALLGAIERALDAHGCGSEQMDDITLVACRRASGTA